MRISWRCRYSNHYDDAIDFETLIPRPARRKAAGCITASCGEQPRADFMESFL
jgi:hypothetical protein